MPTTPEQIADLISGYTDLKQYFENNRNNMEDQLNEAQDQFDKWLQQKDILGEQDIAGTSHICVFQGWLPHSGEENFADDITGTGGFARGKLNTQSSNNVFLHLRLPFKLAESNSTFYFHLTGYACNAGKIINERIAGQYNINNNELINIDTQGDLSPSVYQGGDSALYLRLLLPDSHNVTLAVNQQKIGSSPLLEKGDIYPILSMNETV